MEHVVSIDDLKRIFFGNQSPMFGAEIMFRTTIIYFYTLVLLRWLGSRTIGQLSTIEFMLVIALGSAVGDVMFYPDVPLFHAILVVTLVVGANKALDWTIVRSNKAEKLIDGNPCEAVRDGVLSNAFLQKIPMSRNELFQKLREDGIEQLGEVRRAYIEKDGQVTVFRSKGAIPSGLRIVPPPQLEPPRLVRPKSMEAGSVPLVCIECGRKWGELEKRCPCGADKWTAAATTASEEDVVIVS